MAERKQRLKNGNPPHELSDEERRRGGLARQEALRQQRAEIHEETIERLHELINPALWRIAVELKDDKGAGWAVREVLDRTLGKATTPVEVRGAVEVSGFDALLDQLRMAVHGEELERALNAGDLRAARRAFEDAK